MLLALEFDPGLLHEPDSLTHRRTATNKDEQRLTSDTDNSDLGPCPT